MPMKSAILVVDVITDFEHPDGDKLLASFAEARPALEAVLADARGRGPPVVYANDNGGLWDGDGRGLVERALTDAAATSFDVSPPKPGIGSWSSRATRLSISRPWS